MFETQFTLWLQGFSTQALDSFFLAFTWLGYEQFLQAFLVFILFGINIRYGFILSQAIIWTAAITEAFKWLFHYPRPFMVDNRITLIGQPTVTPSPLTAEGATSFWSRLNPTTVAVARDSFSHYSGSWGLPSGHTAGAVVVWGSLMHWYRQHGLKVVCVLLILLIPLSRLYLGMHFLADILVGYVIGLVMMVFFVGRLFSLPLITHWLFSGEQQRIASRSSFAFLVVFVLPGCAALFATNTPNESITLILGSNLGFYWVWLRGIPFPVSRVKNAIFRLLIAYTLLITIFTVDFITDPWLSTHFGTLGSGLQEIVLNGTLVLIGIEFLVKIGLLRRHSTFSEAKASQ